MNRRTLLRNLSLAIASASVIALTAGSMITSAEARYYSQASGRPASKGKKPPICFEDGCKGDRCIFCTR